MVLNSLHRKLLLLLRNILPSSVAGGAVSLAHSAAAAAVFDQALVGAGEEGERETCACFSSLQVQFLLCQ